MRGPVRVLEVLGRSAGGIGRHVALVAGALNSAELDVDIAGPPDLTVAMPRAVIPVEIPGGVLGHLRAVARLRSIVHEGGYAVVHAHGLRAGIDAGLACRRARARCLLSVHNIVRPDVQGRGKALFYRWAEPLSVRLSDKTFAASEDMARHLRTVAGGAAAKIEVLYLGIEDAPSVARAAEEVRAEASVPEGAHMVVTAARLHPQKNLPVMLAALRTLTSGQAQKKLDVYLVVLGEGPERQRLEAQAQAMGVDGRVRWMGFRSDISDFLAAADVFCLSSNWEAVPLAIKEAVQVGTPVVSTDVGGVDELISDRSSGRLVPKGDAGALASALAEVLSSPEIGARYVERARIDLQRRFSTERMLERLREEYRWAAR